MKLILALGVLLAAVPGAAAGSPEALHAACLARAGQTGAPREWKTVLFIFGSADARVGLEKNRSELKGDTIVEAVRAYLAFAKLAQKLTDGKIRVKTKVITIREPLARLAKTGDYVWPHPDEVFKAGEKYVNGESYDSYFTLWPTGNISEAKTPCLGTYLGDRRMTYATLPESDLAFWRRPTFGEPFLHEWLHGVARFFQSMNFVMPAGDADGAEKHGFTRGADGWLPYYAVLMRGEVTDKSLGIPPQAWRCGTPTDPPRP